MIIRPEQLNDFSVILLAFFCLFMFHPKNKLVVQNRSIYWFNWILCCFVLLSFIEITSFSNNSPFFPLRLLRSAETILLFSCVIQYILNLPPTTTIRRNKKWLNPLLLLCLSIELIYCFFRYTYFLRINMVPLRPLLLQIPLLIPMGLAGWVVCRKIWLIEQKENEMLKQPITIWQCLIHPTHKSTKLLRALILLILLAFIIFGFFVSPYWQQVTLGSVIYVDILASLLIISVITILGLYNPTNINIGVRLLTLTLSTLLFIISILGWILTYSFLQQNGQLSEYMLLAGDFLDLINEPPPPPTQLQQQLSQLLLTVVLFQVGSSLLFVGGFIIFFRNSIQRQIKTILQAIGKTEAGDLSHQIPDYQIYNELDTIAIAFNTMTRSLDNSQKEMIAYQSNLEQIVKDRTEELQLEIEKRKAIELKQLLGDERKRIAQETHDGALQTLSAISYQLQSADKLLDQDKPALEKRLKQLSMETNFAIKELRHMIHDLNLQILDNGLEEAIYNIIIPLQRTFKGNIYCQLNDIAFTLPQNKLIDVVRIIQEALHNAYKHSHAKNLWVIAKEENKSIRITIKDDGQGFDIDDVLRGYGLSNMKARARRLGSELAIYSQDEQGTCIQFHISSILNKAQNSNDML